MVITLGHSSNLRRRSGEHFLKSPQRLLPLMLFFSKKVKWVHLGMVVLVWENYTPGYQLPPTPTPPKLLKNRQILTWGWRNTVAGTFPWWPHPPESSHCNVHNNKLKTDQNPFFICVPTLVCSLLELLVSQTFHHSKNLPRYPPIMFNFPAKFCLNTQNY